MTSQTSKTVYKVSCDWIESGPKCGRRYQMMDANGKPTGWWVVHCGHPTALWPYYILDPKGRMVIHQCGRAFQFVRDARSAAERLHRGEITPVHNGIHWCVPGPQGGVR